MSTLKIDLNDDVEVLKACHAAIGEVIKLNGGTLRAHMSLAEHSHYGALGGDTTGPAADQEDIKVGDEITVTGTVESDTQGVVSAVTTDKRVDTNGVAFNPEFCGNAAKPFYSSGKRVGQWKKRQGVSDDKYDAWYTEMLVLVGPDDNTDEGPDEEIDTASAFGGQSEQSAQPTGEPIPEDCGSFMGWVSAHQAAGAITPEDIGQAYTTAGIQMVDIFPPTDPEAVKQNIAKVYAILAARVGA